MSHLFNEIAQIISNVSNIPIDKIHPHSHLINDLQVDSLGILDATFDIEKKYDIKIPIENWIHDTAENPTAFTMDTLTTKIQQLIDQK